MITKIAGKLVAVGEDRVTIAPGSGFSYDVLIPRFLVKFMLSKTGEDVELFTHHYLEGSMGGSSLIPRLVGFVSAEEREFFEKFITVPDVGVKKALKSFVIPTSEIASAIEMNDVKTLEKLPGIGKRTAQKIVAELKDKMGKFALIKERAVPVPPAAPALRDEVCDILLQLGYSLKEAENMVDAAAAANPEIKSAEALVQAIYKQKKSG